MEKSIIAYLPNKEGNYKPVRVPNYIYGREN
jgi:hypothetical protein